MKFGKLENIEDVDFSLPADAAVNAELMANWKKDIDVRPAIYIGCTGWSMKEWVGKVYPKGTKPKGYLQQYGKQFNTIELNTTHYRIPTPETIADWYHHTPDDFRFCPKIPQIISHSRNFASGSGRLEMFAESIQSLEEKLGHSFLQLPPHFDTKKFGELAHFVENFPSHIPLAVEFRHSSWFTEKENIEKAARLLGKYQMSMVITDVAGRRDVLHQALPCPTAFIRFVGNGLHPTDYQRIDQWVEKLKQWFDQGLECVYFFPHEPDNLLAPELSVYLAQKITQVINGVHFRGPKLLDEQEGKQISLF